MYTIQMSINKSFSQKYLRQYTKEFHPTNEDIELVAGWIINCLYDYRQNVLKLDEPINACSFDIIRNIQVVRIDSTVVISTSPDLYVDIYSLAGCIIEEVACDFNKLLHLHGLVNSYFNKK